MSAQVAVAVAGFAGVAAAFGSEPIHSWSHVDRMRLRFLFIDTPLPLIFSLFHALLMAQIASAIMQFIRLILYRGHVHA